MVGDYVRKYVVSYPNFRHSSLRSFGRQFRRSILHGFHVVYYVVSYVVANVVFYVVSYVRIFNRACSISVGLRTHEAEEFRKGNRVCRMQGFAQVLQSKTLRSEEKPPCVIGAKEESA